MRGPTEVLDDLKGVFEEKNKDYSNSWEKVGVLKRVMADESGPQTFTLSSDSIRGHVITGDDAGDKYVTIRVSPDFFDEQDEREVVLLSDTPKAQSQFEENIDGLVTRLLDKLIRAYNLTLLKDEPALDNESTVDAWEDLTGYSAMGTSLVEREKHE
jgi:hypothetical protein